MNPSERRPQAAALAAPKPGELADRITTALVLGQLALPSVDEWHRLIEAESPADRRTLLELVSRYQELLTDSEAVKARQIREAFAQGVA